MMGKYEKQANEFLRKTNTTMTTKFVRHGVHFPNDIEKRDIYSVTLKRENREYTFNFGQSINNSGFKLMNTNTNKEVRYTWMEEALLYCQQFKNDIERYENEIKKFVLGKLRGSYGYDNDSIGAKETYDKVVEEYKNVCILWNDTEIGELQEVE